MTLALGAWVGFAVATAWFVRAPARPLAREAAGVAALTAVAWALLLTTTGMGYAHYGCAPAHTPFEGLLGRWDTARVVWPGSNPNTGGVSALACAGALFGPLLLGLRLVAGEEE